MVVLREGIFDLGAALVVGGVLRGGLREADDDVILGAGAGGIRGSGDALDAGVTDTGLAHCGTEVVFVGGAVEVNGDLGAAAEVDT